MNQRQLLKELTNSETPNEVSYSDLRTGHFTLVFLLNDAELSRNCINISAQIGTSWYKIVHVVISISS